MNTKPKVKLCFDYEFDEQIAAETADRGYWGHSHVELANGVTRPVVFYDAVRLQQDLEEESSQGKPFIAEKGLIVLKDVTRENMETAIQNLVDEGYFD